MWGDNDTPKKPEAAHAWLIFGFFLWCVLYLSEKPEIYAMAGMAFAAGLFMYETKARWLMVAGLVLTLAVYIHQFGWHVR